MILSGVKWKYILLQAVVDKHVPKAKMVTTGLKYIENKIIVYFIVYIIFFQRDFILLLAVQLTDEHLHKIREFEKKRAPSLKERQAHFQEAFDKDLLHYKSQGIVPSE